MALIKSLVLVFVIVMNSSTMASKCQSGGVCVAFVESDDSTVIVLTEFNTDPSQTVAMCNGKEVTVMLSKGDVPTSSDDVILGTDGADVISAMGGNDTICGLAGDDWINGGRGEDWIDAGAGDDTVFGGNESDLIFGGPGIDNLFGGPGGDLVYGGDEGDALTGNSGDDVLVGDDGIDKISGGSGDDHISVGNGSNVGTSQSVTGGNGDDTIFGGPDADEIRAEAGDDTIYGGLGDDLLFGGAGSDIVFGNAGHDYIRGNAGVDTLYGGQGDDQLDGLSGNDVLWGGAGADTLTGSTGIDTLYGQSGDDVLFGGGGNDVLGGNTGSDYCDGQGGGGNAASNCEIEINITAGGVVADQSWKGRLYTPTNITKIGALYFIVDSWHHRVIYSDELSDPIEDWIVLDDQLAGPHSIVSDGEFYVVDDTGRHGLKVYTWSDTGLDLVQQVGPLGVRTHRVQYDSVGKAFYVLSSNSQSMSRLAVEEGRLKVSFTKSLPFLDRSYTRSFSIFGDAMYFTSGPGVITQTSFRNGRFEVLDSFAVPREIREGADIFRTEDGWWYLTGSPKSIIRSRSLMALEEGDYEDVYEALGFDGTPYYLSFFDGRYFVPQISQYSGIRSFVHDENANIADVRVDFDFGPPTAADYDRRESWPR